VLQPIGSNQTDVFLVNNSKQLVRVWSTGPGIWNGPQPLGPAGLVPTNAHLAVSQQFGINQTDLFVVDTTGRLNVFWSDGTGAWNGPEAISQAGFAHPGAKLAVSQQIGADQTDVFVIDTNGQLNVFWVDGGGPWNGPDTIGPASFAASQGFLAASQQIGANQTDVFVVDENGQLNVFWVDGTGLWKGPQTIGPAGIALEGDFIAASQQFGLPGQTDVFILNRTGTDSPGWPTVFWVDGQGAWKGPAALVTEV
jgi:hypothetical protein